MTTTSTSPTWLSSGWPSSPQSSCPGFSPIGFSLAPSRPKGSGRSFGRNHGRPHRRRGEQEALTHHSGATTLSSTTAIATVAAGDLPGDQEHNPSSSSILPEATGSSRDREKRVITMEGARKGSSTREEQRYKTVFPFVKDFQNMDWVDAANVLGCCDAATVVNRFPRQQFNISLSPGWFFAIPSTSPPPTPTAKAAGLHWSGTLLWRPKLFSAPTHKVWLQVKGRCHKSPLHARSSTTRNGDCRPKTFIRYVSEWDRVAM